MVSQYIMDCFTVAYYLGCLYFCEYLFDNVLPDRTLNLSLQWRTELRCQKCFIRRVAEFGSGLIGADWSFLGFRCRPMRDLNFRLGQGCVTLYFKDCMNRLISVIIQDYRNLLGLGSRTKVFCDEQRRLVTLSEASAYATPAYTCVPGEPYRIMVDREGLTQSLIPAGTQLTLGFEPAVITAAHAVNPMSPSARTIFFDTEHAVRRAPMPAIGSARSAFTPIAALQSLANTAGDDVDLAGLRAASKPQNFYVDSSDNDADSDCTLSPIPTASGSTVPTDPTLIKQFPERKLLRARRLTEQQKARDVAATKPCTSPNPEITNTAASQTVNSGFELFLNGQAVVINSIDHYTSDEGVVYVIISPLPRVYSPISPAVASPQPGPSHADDLANNNTIVDADVTMQM